MLVVVVDAFTDKPFAGNPAGVAVLGRFPNDATMQLVAAEMNLSETAFVVARPDGDFDLRWFTPTTEVDLCGHATLASAHVVGSARFHTRSGVLTAEKTDEGKIEMDFPSDPPVWVEEAPGGIAENPRWFGKGRFDHLLELGSAREVRTYRPDLGAISALGSRGLIITAPSDIPGFDCVSRVFGPNVGIPEDPVTGSAHCTLAPFWAERTGKTALIGEQASKRTGVVSMRLHNDRVILGGSAVRVAETNIFI